MIVLYVHGKVEDAYHYFFSCVKYNILQNDLFNEKYIFNVENVHSIGTICYREIHVAPSVKQKSENLFFKVQLFQKDIWTVLILNDYFNKNVYPELYKPVSTCQLLDLDLKKFYKLQQRHVFD